MDPNNSWYLKTNNRHLANLRKERKQYWKQRQHITDMRVFENQK